MRLIDADKLLFLLEEWELNETPISTYPKPKEFTADDMQRMIWRTIRDCESAVEEQPTVKAIPIERIEEWLDKTTGTRDGEDISQLPEQLKFAIEMINLMEMEWEKENGTEESNRNIGL